MAIPAQGEYRVVRRHRGIRAAVGDVIPSASLSPQMFLALCRARVLVPVDVPAKSTVARVARLPVGGTQPAEPVAANEAEAHAVEPERPRSKKWSTKK